MPCIPGVDRMSCAAPPPPAACSSVQSDPLLLWVNSQLHPEGQGPSRPTPRDSEESARGGTQATLTPSISASSSQRRASGLVDLKPWQLKYSELKIQRPLGEGSFGKVGEQAEAAARVCQAPLPAGACVAGVGGGLGCRPRARGCSQLHVGLCCLLVGAQVFLATWNETLVAVKLLLSTDDAAAAAAGSSASLSLPLPVMDELQKEAGLMASLRHPNVVLFLGVCASPPAVVTGACLGSAASWSHRSWLLFVRH